MVSCGTIVAMVVVATFLTGFPWLPDMLAAGAFLVSLGVSRG